MHGFELFLLGRELTRIGEQSMPDALYHRLPPGVRAIVVDIAEHPDSSIGEITGRTGFRQSQVSAAIDRLRQHDVIVTTPDAQDRRRTLVRLHPDTPRRAAGQLSVSVDEYVATAIGTDQPEHLAEVLDALGTLARWLTPPGSAS